LRVYVCAAGGLRSGETGPAGPDESDQAIVQAIVAAGVVQQCSQPHVYNQTR
jgi:hypothetical protein